MTEEMSELIERFNESNDEFAIGMNFMVAGIGGLQGVIKHLQGETFEPQRDRAALVEASSMLTFAAARLDGHPQVSGFIERYRRLIEQLLETN